MTTADILLTHAHRIDKAILLAILKGNSWKTLRLVYSRDETAVMAGHRVIEIVPRTLWQTDPDTAGKTA